MHKILRKIKVGLQYKINGVSKYTVLALLIAFGPIILVGTAEHFNPPLPGESAMIALSILAPFTFFPAGILIYVFGVYAEKRRTTQNKSDSDTKPRRTFGWLHWPGLISAALILPFILFWLATLPLFGVLLYWAILLLPFIFIAALSYKLYTSTGIKRYILTAVLLLTLYWLLTTNYLLFLSL